MTHLKTIIMVVAFAVSALFITAMAGGADRGGDRNSQIWANRGAAARTSPTDRSGLRINISSRRIAGRSVITYTPKDRRDTRGIYRSERQTPQADEKSRSNWPQSVSNYLRNRREVNDNAQDREDKGSRDVRRNEAIRDRGNIADRPAARNYASINFNPRYNSSIYSSSPKDRPSYYINQGSSGIRFNSSHDQDRVYYQRSQWGFGGAAGYHRYGDDRYDKRYDSYNYRNYKYRSHNGYWLIATLPGACVRVVYRDRYYYHDGWNYYYPYSYGGTYWYEVLPPFEGVYIDKLPADAIVVIVEGKVYYYFDGIFMVEVAGRYKVVENPLPQEFGNQIIERYGNNDSNAAITVTPY